MLRSLQVAKTGLEAQQTMLDVVSNNLANVNTTAYKKSRAVFQDLLYDIVRCAGRLQLADHAAAKRLATRQWLGGGGHLAQLHPWHHRGHRQSCSIWRSAGRASSRCSCPMATPPTPAMATSSSTRTVPWSPATASSSRHNSRVTGVTARQRHHRPRRLGHRGGCHWRDAADRSVADRFFHQPGRLARLGGNLFAETTASGQAVTGNPGANNLGDIAQKTLENSNVNVAEELVNLITAQRAFEVASRAISSSDQILQKLGQSAM
jgi:flagellar basal-body rod protein FlgG